MSRPGQATALYNGQEAHDTRVDAVGHAASMGRAAATQALAAATQGRDSGGRGPRIAVLSSSARPQGPSAVQGGGVVYEGGGQQLIPSARGKIEFQPKSPGESKGFGPTLSSPELAA